LIKENGKNALLEVGTEEIPYLYIEPALRQIGDFVSKAFSVLGLKCAGVETYATSRRLVLIAENLAEKSEDRIEYVLGPSLKAAKDACGRYTQAAIGFALKNGVTPKELITKTTKKGDYLSFFKKIKGEKTEKLLVKIFSEMIGNISFPKTMLWEESGFKFARPIRNIVALYGRKIIKFKIADVISANWTIGLHTYDSSKIKIDLPENYLLTMKNKSVIIEQKERRKAIKESIESVVKNIGSVIPDESLIDEINYLVEYPTAVLCSFDKKYLTLPHEVLSVCMKKSQKCFSVNDRNGKFSNYFVGIRNGISKHQEIVREGYEKVLAARLADAEFFYNNDLKKGLKLNIEKLKGVVLHREIGTVYEKLERVKYIASLFNEEFNMHINGDILEKAVMFSKVDLLSEMVFEYPELQGIIGRVYALKLGESEDIALSIEQHYWPLTASGELPSNNIAFLVSLSDKIDTLVTSFSIGLEPSGSADPYGLRRAGVGFIRLAMENLPNYDIGRAIKGVFKFLPENVTNNLKSGNAYERLIDFLWQRIENIFEVERYDSREIKAVTSILRLDHKLKDLGTLRLKLDALRSAKIRYDFSSIITAFKRINNIINQAKKQDINVSNTVREDLLVLDVEKAVYAAAKKVKMKVDNHILKSEYNEVFDEILRMKPLIDGFFEKVMVMAEEETLKLNRISLINYIKNIFAEFVDFSCLQI